MHIAIINFPGCDVINFEINIIFLIKPFSNMTKKSRQKFKYLENKGKIKSISLSFFRAVNAKNCLRPEGATSERQPLNIVQLLLLLQKPCSSKSLN